MIDVNVPLTQVHRTNEDLYKEVKALAAIRKERSIQIILIKEGMRLVLIKYGVR